MVLLACVSIISIVISAIQSGSNPGDLNNSYFGTFFSNWDGSFCTASPYLYFTPYSFTFKNKTTGKVYSNPAYCGWPVPNTAFRISIGIVTFLVLLPLFFKTFFSGFATPIFFLGSLLWYSSFILDSNSYTLGASACNNGFSGTSLALDFQSSTEVHSCDPGQVYVGTIFIDLVITTFFFLLWLCWDNCSDLYNGDSEASSSLKTPIV